MPVLTRKRKAELEAAEKETQIQSPLEIEQTTPKPPSKRQKRADPFRRIDPFRPLSPPPKTVIRQRRNVWNFSMKKIVPKRQHPLPVIFFTVPTTNSDQQVSSKSRSSNDINMIMTTKSLFEHVDKHGFDALPSHETLVSWLEDHKDEFVDARTKAARLQTTPTRRIQVAPNNAGNTAGGNLETPATRHPAVRAHANRPVVLVANDGIFRRAIRRARHTAANLLHRAAAAFEDYIAEGPALIPRNNEEIQGRRQHIESEKAIAPTSAENNREISSRTEADIKHIRVRPIVPPLDPRFFHPNGQLQSVYKYLTAQIPLPRQWAQWAINNGIPNVPGRGDIREPGTYVAEDNFDYDALYQAIHRGRFRTGRMEIDHYPDYWPAVQGKRDNMIADLSLHPFQSSQNDRNDKIPRKSGAPSPEPQSGISLEPSRVPAVDLTPVS
ncbi:hypothetical protein F4804DRAFT_352173 [Jackrogersella minutella]|nr:hypothetical protein F4804DRAFT_352173 [Jackrogersella minutella]